MAVTPEIKTKFSLDGVRQAVSGLRSLVPAARQMANGIRQSVRNTFEPMRKDLDRARRSIRLLQTTTLTTARVGFGTLRTSSRLAFLGISVGAAGAAAQVGSIGTAAILASRQVAKEMDKIAKDAKRLGMSTEDISILGFAAEQEGADPEAAIKGIARLASQFTDVRQRIAEANGEFDRLMKNAREDAYHSLRRGDIGGLASAAEAVAAGRSGSMSAIQERRTLLQQQLEHVETFGFRNPARNQNESLAQEMWLARVRREIEDLRVAEQSLVKSLGPAGEALFGLERFGLDVETATKGGTESFFALGEAIKSVEDPAERLRYSVLLFGKDAGPKMLNLLMAGREGFAEYRKEAVRLGIVVDKELAEMGEAYETAATNFKRAIQGMKMEVGRSLLPELTASTKQVTDWVAANRNAIAGVMRSAFTHLRNFAYDVIDLFNSGGTAKLRTGWLETARTTIVSLHQSWKGFRSDVEALMQRGEAKSFPWLNILSTGIWGAIDLSKDLWAILRGRDAQNFPWLNEMRDSLVRIYHEAVAWITAFAEKFEVAFSAFMDMVMWIRDQLQSFLDLFGYDLTTTLLFLGLMKITGLLNLAIGSLKVMAGILGRLAIPVALSAGLTNLAAAIGAVTGVALPATAAAGGAVAGRVAPAAVGAGVGLAANVGRASRFASVLGMGSRAGWIGAGGAALGYGAYELAGFGDAHRQRVEDLNAIIELATKRNAARKNVEDYAQMFHNPADVQKYWASQGIKIDDAWVKWREQSTGRQDSIYQKGMTPGDYVQAQREQVTRTVKLDVTLGGEQFDFYGTPEQGDRLERAAAALERRRY